MKRGKQRTPALGQCVFSIPAPDDSAQGSRVQILPAGEFRAEDGRPYEIDAWRLDDTIAAAVIERAAARQRDTVIDYEHMTLSGGPAPAAGWWHDLEWVPDSGLWIVDARFTATAIRHIKENEYRYVSAVFTYDPDTGAVLRILHVAITNDPALDGMAELEAVAARFSPTHQPEDSPMNEELLALLGLAADASEEEALAALKALKDKVGTLETSLQEQTDQVAALKAADTGNPDPSKYVSVAVVEDLKGQMTALSNRLSGQEVDDLVVAALKDGKLLQSQEQWARDLGETDIDKLRDYIESAEPIAALRGRQTTDVTLNEDEDGLTADEIAVCKATGVSPEDYKQQKAGGAQ